MGGSKKCLVVVLMIMISLAAATPPGIANNPSHSSCKDPKYKHCYNLVHVCPKFCPNGCTTECSSCKPICIGSGPTTLPPQGGGNNKYPPYSPPPTPSSSPSPHPPTPSSPSPPNTTPSSPPPPNNTPSSPSPPNTTPSSPSPPDNTPSSPSPPNTTPSSPSPPNNTPSSPSPPNTTPSSPPPPNNTPSSPSPPNSTPSSPSPPNNTPSSPSPPDNTPSSPSPPKTTPPSPSPPSSPTTPTPPSTPSSPKTAKCKSKYYPQCYNTEHVCPNTCPGGCEVDCVTCKPVCKCDRPGAVCQDPRFIGGDGITFYFHGKKDRDFCLVSDPNLHINAHFIGKRNEKMTRDFTWVQSIAILFNKHKIFIGALKTATWEDSIDRLALSIDGQPLTLPENEGSTWQSKTEQAGISITRISDSNNVEVEVKGKFKITAKVVPITEQDSKIHNYGITKDDCFAHLDLGFKFYSLTDQVNGVLGQTYRPGYMSRVNLSAKNPVMGGDKEFETSGILAADCAVARFTDRNGFDGNMQNLELPSLSCASGIDGQGVVCKR